MSQTNLLDIERCRGHAIAAARANWRGEVSRVSGVIVEATGVPAAMGELVTIDRGLRGSVNAEVVGFRGNTTLLMLHGELEGTAPRQTARALGRPFSMSVGDALLGRVLDGFGDPIDGGQPLSKEMAIRSVRSEAPPPLSRARIDETMRTGVRAIDGTITLGRGQRLGIFAGSGVGKSTLLGQITRGSDADIVVVCLIGERGREVRDFLESTLDEESRKKSVMVVATSDRSPIERFLAPFVAVTTAEHFRDQGKSVLLVMDSITRFAAASREIGLAAGEPPTVRGYPPSFFATIPKLVERLGCANGGSITGLLTVLLDQDDPNDPVSDTLRGLLDGHLYLSRDIAQRGLFPAIDVLASLSRLMPELVDPEQMEHARLLREALARWKEGRDLVEIGAYKAGTNPGLDRAIAILPQIEAFLCQGTHETSSLEETRALMRVILEGAA